MRGRAGSLSSCCLQAGSSVPTLVSLQTFGWCVVTSPSETLSLDALTAVPLSLPILTARMLCCSHTHGLGGIASSPASSPVQGEGFAFILLLSDRLSHTEINPADITVCVCLKKDVCGC